MSVRPIMMAAAAGAVLLICIAGACALAHDDGDGGGSVALEEQTGYTAAVPSSFIGEASRRGTVEPLHYQSEDYVRGSSPVTKTAYVYLPYGYDGSSSYNILYLMHGWGGHAGEFFEYGNVVDIIDNMIEQGVIEPLIVVSPSFYNSNSSTDSPRRWMSSGSSTRTSEIT